MNYIIKFNHNISISAIVIVYDVILLFLYFTQLLPQKVSKHLLSIPLLLNFFIIYVMFTTNCDIDEQMRLSLFCIKSILLFILICITQLSFINFAISLILLVIYYMCSHINKVYSCNVKSNELIEAFILSTLSYFIIYNTKT